MMMGTYCFSMLRLIFDDEPLECLSCNTTIFGDGDHYKCDYHFNASFRFPNGGIGEAMTNMRGPMLWKPAEARVTTKEVLVSDEALPSTQEKILKRQMTIHGFMHAVLWHRIDVKDSYVIRNKADGEIIRQWTHNSSQKAYTYETTDGRSENRPSKDWWMSYRWQLEEFVNRVKSRQTQYWISGEDSVKQMTMIDMAYEKSGLGLRPTSLFS